MISAAQALHFGLSSPSAPVFLTHSFWDLLTICSERTAFLETQTSRPYSEKEPSEMWGVARTLARVRTYTQTLLHPYHSTCVLAVPPRLQRNHSSFIGATSFSALQNTLEEGCMCNFWLEAVYLWP